MSNNKNSSEIASSDVAEDSKRALEERKLQLEISELEKVWYKKPTFFVPLVGALSSIFILWVTGFFNTKIESLTNKRDVLRYETEKLAESKKGLRKDSIKLQIAKKALLIDNAALVNEAKKAYAQYDSARIALVEKQKETQKTKKQNDSLNKQVIKKQAELYKISETLAIALRPNIEFNLHAIYDNKNPDIGIYIANSGSGPAYLRSITAYYKGVIITTTQKKHDFWSSVVKILGLEIIM